MDHGKLCRRLHCFRYATGVTLICRPKCYVKTIVFNNISQLITCGYKYVFFDLVIQDEFDSAWKDGKVTSAGYTGQASNMTVMAYRLMIQTGDPKNPLNRNNVGCDLGNTCTVVSTANE